MERIYADPEQRMNKTNRYLFWGSLIICVFNVIVLYFSDGGKYFKNPRMFAYIMTGVVIPVIILMSVVTYGKLVSVKNTRRIVLAAVSVVHIFCNSVTNNSAVSCMIFALAIVCILYYDKRFSIQYGTFVLAYLLLNRLVVILVGSTVDMKSDIYIMLLSVVLYICVIGVSTMFELYNGDIFGVADDAYKEQSAMMDHILDISDVVSDNTALAEKQMKKLEQSTEMVLSSMKEIAAGTSATSESIENQTAMTQSIQNTISTTAEKSDTMVQVSNEVETSVQNGVDAVRLLNHHTEIIVNTNKQVVENMDNLQEMAASMKIFAETIFEISSQTNLLALNASIESARAGEAGRGFAVVADQIRLLAEQTRESTQSISELIEKLNGGTTATAEAINNSVEAMEEQVQAIGKVDESFAKVDAGISELSVDIQGIDSMMQGMVEANNTIIESISQLSATSEEIAASTESMIELATQNQENARETQKMLNVVAVRAAELNQYHK